MSRNHYESLSIPRDASTADIRSSYLELARRFHPDRAPREQKRQATLLFQQLAESYRVLSDPQLRAAYDRTIDRDSGSLIGAKPNQHGASSTMFANPVSSASRTYKHRPPSPSRSHHHLIPSSNPPNYSRRPPSPSNYGTSSIPFPPPGAYPRRYPSMNDSHYWSQPQSPSSNTPRFSNDPTFARFTSPSEPAPPASLESIDPFSLFDELLAEQKESRDSRTGFDAMERMLFTGGSERDWRVGHDYPSYREVTRAVGGPRKMSASWNEGERRKNGEWNMRTGSQRLEETADGTIKFSSSSIKVSSGGSGFMPDQHPSPFVGYQVRSNRPPSLPAARPHRPPSPSFLLATTPLRMPYRSGSHTTPARPPSLARNHLAPLNSGHRQPVATNQQQLAIVRTRPRSPALIPIPASTNSVLVGSAAREPNRGNGVASSAEPRGAGSSKRISFDR